MEIKSTKFFYEHTGYLDGIKSSHPAVADTSGSTVRDEELLNKLEKAVEAVREAWRLVAEIHDNANEAEEKQSKEIAKHLRPCLKNFKGIFAAVHFVRHIQRGHVEQHLGKRKREQTD
jgi:phosphoribosylformylglycinamidine (FGAM) synthase PurS component